MAILLGLLVTVLVVVSLMLIFVILMQKSKSGGGMGTAFGGGMSESIFGSRAGNVLTKATVILTVIFLADSLVLAMLVSKRSGVHSILDPNAPASMPVGAPGGAPAGPAMPEVPAVPSDPSAPAPTPVAPSQ